MIVAERIYYLVSVGYTKLHVKTYFSPFQPKNLDLLKLIGQNTVTSIKVSGNSQGQKKDTEF